RGPAVSPLTYQQLALALIDQGNWRTADSAALAGNARFGVNFQDDFAHATALYAGGMVDSARAVAARWTTSQDLVARYNGFGILASIDELTANSTPGAAITPRRLRPTARPMGSHLRSLIRPRWRSWMRPSVDSRNGRCTPSMRRWRQPRLRLYLCRPGPMAS